MYAIVYDVALWLVGYPQSLGGAKIFDFRRILFCLGYRLSKHEMTTGSENLGGMAPHLAKPMAWPTLYNNFKRPSQLRRLPAVAL